MIIIHLVGHCKNVFNLGTWMAIVKNLLQFW